MSDRFAMLDGNEAAAGIAYDFTEIAAIYPITPSSPMAEYTDVWSALGRKNCFGQKVSLVEMQSEAGAAGAIHGALQAGALATSFTSSQGLMLMIPVLHRIAGERLPGVLHVAARTVGTHAMSIFGDHSDVMSCRNTGFAQLCTGSVQEVVDLAGVAHLAAIKSSTPFMHFFDGFRTSHEIAKVEMIDKKALTDLIDKDALSAFRKRALNPEHPSLRSTVQNPDVFFQIREASNPYYDAIPEIVQSYMDEVAKISGRSYHLFDYYGASDADKVIVAMGSVSGACMEAVDYLNAKGEKTGFLQVHLYRPFSIESFVKAIPASVKKIAVLDRTKEPGAVGEPLYEDVCASLFKAGRIISVIGGRYGLSSKDTDPSQIVSVFNELNKDEPKNNFTIGIEDDVTYLSLPYEKLEDIGDENFSCKFWGLGGDGTVGANKNTAQIIGGASDTYCQAYFEYDAKKSFGVTKSHLRFAPKPIRGSYYVKSADFIACHNRSYIGQYDMVSELKEGGTFLLNCDVAPENIEAFLPAGVKKALALKKAKFYIIDATAIARELGLGSHTNTILQSAFFGLCDLIPQETALELMKNAAKKSYAKKGDDVLNKNIAAIERGAGELKRIEIPASWASCPDDPAEDTSALPETVKNILLPINKQEGDFLPVSAFKGYVDGYMELGMTAFEKRGIAVSLPRWEAEKCAQCNKCAFVCPHAAIRPFLLNDEEAKNAPEGFKSAEGKAQLKAYKYALAVSEFDCTGCGSCVSVCPAKALTLEPAVPDKKTLPLWDYALSVSDKETGLDLYSVKGSQFRTPLVEFSAACAGCGETPYAKLLTQLFGDRVYWANATGCSQAWGSAMPGIPYTKNKRGFGPAWTNSLFENNAELCLGLYLADSQQREAVREKVSALAATAEGSVKAAAEKYLASFSDFEASRIASDELVAALSGDNSPEAGEILSAADHLAKKTFWMYGGDGWAYDIGFGGLDHVIASGKNVNAFIIDTEVYSNTGGQSSKATPVGAVAKFDSSGKKSLKKDLGAIFMSYGNVYVAQVAMGADNNQLIKALKEAEAYDGPSVVIAYTPCSAHGIRAGMGKTQDEMKRAVDSGYWLLYRYNPLNKEKPFTLDSKAPSMSFEEFLDGETRFASLKRSFPENAAAFAKMGAESAEERYNKYSNI
ncbi:MAG: pyruvate:ferredoxin (flavodoxin) oxidoreductase [Oscillospiraceae bacterium]|nr:pyruvate:ferredoxin (flavodoxin) oxidoreductase [Oscillospiraceae bacterium]